jgi:uncharacterized protein YkuJ
MRRVQQLNKDRCATKKRQNFELNGWEDYASVDAEYKKSRNGPDLRLCGNLSEFTHHANSILKQGTGGRGRGG